MCRFFNKLGQIKSDYNQKIVQMSFIIMLIMQLSLTYYSLGVTISFCKFWFENDTDTG